MRALFDHGTPASLQSFLPGHTVREAKAQGWDTFKNGDSPIAQIVLLKIITPPVQEVTNLDETA